jgi:hypothetical protein
MRLLGFTETRRFTKKLIDLMSDEEYSRLQIYLCRNPEFGSIIKGSGGIRTFIRRNFLCGLSFRRRLKKFWKVCRRLRFETDLWR